MPVDQELSDVITRIDSDTTAIGGVVKDLRDQVKTNMTQAEVTVVKDTLSAIATRLEGIASDPNNPIPPGPLPQVRKP